MASLDDVMTALKNADASGDTAGAARLAQIAQSMRQSGAIKTPETSAVSALTKSAIGNTVPALTGLAGAGAALSAGTPVIAGASAINPLLGLLTAGGIGLAGGIGGGYLGNKAQDAVTDQIPADVKEATGFSPQQRALEQEQHPYASFAGELLPNALAFRPGAVTPIVTAAGKTISSGAQRAGMGVLGAGLEAGNEAYAGQGFDPVKIAMAGAFQAGSATPTRLGNKLFPANHVPAEATTEVDPKLRALLSQEDTSKYTPPSTSPVGDAFSQMRQQLGGAEPEVTTTGVRTPTRDVADSLLNPPTAMENIVKDDNFALADSPPAPRGTSGDVGRQMRAQEVIDARNAEHDKIAQTLEAQRQDMENRKQAANPEQSASMQEHADQIAAEIKAHQDQIAAEEQHRAHLEETHAHALDEQNRLEAAQKAVEERQRSIEKAISSHPDAIDSAFKVAAEQRKTDVAKMQGENAHPVNDYLAFEAELRKQMQEAPTKSRKQLAIEAKAKAQAEQERIIHQRAENELMIQKLRDQHTESEIRTKRAQADAQEAVNKRNTDHVSDLMVPAVQRAVEAKKKAEWIANLRAEADRQEALKTAQDKVLQANAKKRAIQEITHPAGSKERAAAVKAINAKYASKTGGSSKKSQRGGVDPQVLKELYRGLAKGLSKLTDQPWLKARFPSNEWMTNGDGTPMVMLHGSADTTIVGDIKGMKQGFHAGFVSSPHIFVTKPGRRNKWAVHDSTRTKTGEATENTIASNEGGRLYPVAIKKGNYPHLNFDIGDWSPWSVINDLRSKAIIKDALIKKGTPESAIQGLFNYVTNGVGHADKAQRLTDVLNRAGIDGFFYRNTGESPLRQAREQSIRTNYSTDERLKILNTQAQDPTSFVTWNNGNFQSIYKPTKGEVHPVVGDDVNTSKSKEAGLFGADKDGITELHSGIPLPKEIRDRLDGVVTKFGDMMERIANKRPGVQNTFAKNYVGKAFAEAKNAEAYVGASKSAADVIKEATSDGVKDIPLDPNSKTGGFAAAMQSGLNSAAAKWDEHPVLRGLANFFDNSLAKSNFQVQKVVFPLTKALNSLKSASMITVQGALRLEATTHRVFTEDQLRAAGFTPKEINAYQLQREAYNSAYELQNAKLKEMNQPTISKKDYYYSSRWSGDWHTVITKNSPTGNKQLVWYIRSASESEGKRAIAYLKNKFPELNIDNTTKPQFKGDLRNPDVPRDVASAYRDMLDYFKDDPETSGAIKQAMEAYSENRGMANLGQNKHFLDKAGVRGFIGDKPWLSEKENAYQGAKAQVDYLKNAIRWANNQEMIAKATEVLSHPKIAGTNAAALGQAFLNREMGLNTNVVAPIENFLAKSFGVSRNSLLRGIGDTKIMMYLQTLGFNPMYSLATPLQVFASGPMWHMMMSQEGHSLGMVKSVKTMAMGMSDGLAGIMAHMSHEMGAASAEKFINESGMTEIGKQALRYAEDSGFIKRNIFDEARSVGQHGPMDKVQAGMGWTIGQPERVARLTAFMSFVHHLDQAGNFAGDRMALFHEAETYADRTVGSFKSYDRPLAVDKLGSLGQTGYVYQSFKFVSFHTQRAAWNQLLSHGNIMPLAMLYAGYGLTMGAMNMPGFQEVDGAWNGIKDMIAKYKPDLYIHVKDMDMRTGLLNMLPDTKVFREMSARSIAMNGLGGELTGAAVGPHGSSQVLDIEHPMANIPGSVLAQETKEWGSVLEWLNHPNMDTAKQAIYKNAPPSLKGYMETHVSGFKSGDNPGNQAYFDPNHLDNPKLLPYRRTANDEAYREVGATTTREGNLKETWYRNEQEDARIKQALSSSIVNLLSGIKRGDSEDIKHYAQTYMRLDPEGKGLDQALSQGIVNQHMTPYEQRIASRNAKMLVLQSLKRFKEAPK